MTRIRKAESHTNRLLHKTAVVLCKSLLLNKQTGFVLVKLTRKHSGFTRRSRLSAAWKGWCWRRHPSGGGPAGRSASKTAAGLLLPGRPVDHKVSTQGYHGNGCFSGLSACFHFRFWASTELHSSQLYFLFKNIHKTTAFQSLHRIDLEIITLLCTLTGFKVYLYTSPSLKKQRPVALVSG